MSGILVPIINLSYEDFRWVKLIYLFILQWATEERFKFHLKRRWTTNNLIFQLFSSKTLLKKNIFLIITNNIPLLFNFISFINTHSEANNESFSKYFKFFFLLFVLQTHFIICILMGKFFLAIEFLAFYYLTSIFCIFHLFLYLKGIRDHISIVSYNTCCFNNFFICKLLFRWFYTIFFTLIANFKSRGQKI